LHGVERVPSIKYMNKILQNSTNYRKYTPTSLFTNVSLGRVGNSFPDRIFDILIVVFDRYRAEGGLLWAGIGLARQ
jgi:hypothetical protein